MYLKFWWFLLCCNNPWVCPKNWSKVNFTLCYLKNLVHVEPGVTEFLQFHILGLKKIINSTWIIKSMSIEEKNNLRIRVVVVFWQKYFNHEWSVWRLAWDFPSLDANFLAKLIGLFCPKLSLIKMKSVVPNASLNLAVLFYDGTNL